MPVRRGANAQRHSVLLRYAARSFANMRPQVIRLYIDDDIELTDDLIARINREHLITTELAPADLLFIFGNRDAVDGLVASAADLWKKGYFRWAIVSGGPTPGGDEDEATVLARLMIEAGIPEHAVFTEHRAMNTGENVIFSLPIIEERLGLANVRSVIALGRICGSRRYLMTLQRHWPDVHKMLATVNLYNHPVEAWPDHPAFRARVLSEWRKIEPYRAAGFIVDLPGS